MACASACLLLKASTGLSMHVQDEKSGCVSLLFRGFPGHVVFTAGNVGFQRKNWKTRAPKFLNFRLPTPPILKPKSFTPTLIIRTQDLNLNLNLKTSRIAAVSLPNNLTKEQNENIDW